MKPSSSIHYRIVALDPHAHVFEVECTVASPASDGQAFRLPTWIPGSYLIREFAKNVLRISGRNVDGPVVITKVAKDRWRAAPCRGPLTVTMEVYAFDLSVRTAYLDAQRGFFNGTSVFLCPEGLEAAACEVEIVRPRGAAHARWRVATSLPRRDATEFDFGGYGADNYAALVDHPVEMSDFTLVSFEAGGVPHHVAISGRHRADTTRLAADLQRVCAWQCRLFDPEHGKAPFDHYVFLVAAVGEGYGGLEHRASTSLLCRRDELPMPGMAKVTEDYRTFLGLASHEYFHSWNVKRIRPEVFAPYDLSRENYTRDLWAYEGVTSYYDELALVRSGVLPLSDWLESLGQTVTSVLRGPGRTLQSMAESSFDAWIKFYRPDENAPNAVVSYYGKGALVALALDLTLRLHQTSLDAVMQVLWDRYGRPDKGVPEDTIARIAAEVAGAPLDDFFTRYVRGTEDPPLAELLPRFGLRLEARASSGASDRGGKAAKDVQRVWLGVRLAKGGDTRVQNVLRGSPAERAGLAAGDMLVAIDGLRATPDAIDRLLRDRQPGDPLEIHAFRRDELLTLACSLEPAPADTYWIAAMADADAETIGRRTAWLGAATEEGHSTAEPPD
ncbi:MAG: PDZ domain-containing protein [Casimicrobiaceae bacterium]